MPHPTLLHITHWKAGSQWIRHILRTLFPDRVVEPRAHGEQFLEAPVLPGHVYPTLYLAKREFDAVPRPEDCRRFVIIRDLRDTLVSMYFSFRNVHAISSPDLAETRAVLQSISPESGLVYLIYKVLPHCAHIQTTWLQSGERLFRYEDLIEDNTGVLEEILVRHCGLDLPREAIATAAAANCFEQRTGGRPRGEVDLTAHERKGVRGDWRNHFTERVKEAFIAQNGDLLVRAGYENDNRW